MFRFIRYKNPAGTSWKAFCYQKLFQLFIVWINFSRDLNIFANSRPSASNFKSFLNNFYSPGLLTVGQNNFGNKIPFLLDFYFPFCLEFYATFPLGLLCPFSFGLFFYLYFPFLFNFYVPFLFFYWIIFFLHSFFTPIVVTVWISSNFWTQLISYEKLQFECQFFVRLETSDVIS